jgi:hypothetical protein
MFHPERDFRRLFVFREVKLESSWYCQGYLSLYTTHVGPGPEMATRRVMAGSVMRTTLRAAPVMSSSPHTAISNAKSCNHKHGQCSDFVVHPCELEKCRCRKGRSKVCGVQLAVPQRAVDVVTPYIIF